MLTLFSLRAVDHQGLEGSQTFEHLGNRPVHRILVILGTFVGITAEEELHQHHLEQQFAAITRVVVVASGHTFVAALASADR